MVVDAAGKPVLSQLVDVDGDDEPDELVFQTDLAASQTKTFKLRAGPRKPAARGEFMVYGRFVRERHDDFAWENDLVAHRMYGPELETTAKEPLVSSGIDTWVKRAHRLVVNDWYMTGDYHRDTRRRRGLLRRRQVARLRRAGHLGRRQAERVEELHVVARAGQRADPPGVRAPLRAVGRRPGRPRRRDQTRHAGRGHARSTGSRARSRAPAPQSSRPASASQNTPAAP